MSTASWNQSKRFTNRAEIARFSRDEKVTQYLCWFDHLYFAWYLSIDTWFRYHFDENFGNFAKNYDLLIENSRERLFVEFRVCCNSIAHLLEGPQILLQHMPTFTFPSLTTISKIPAAAAGMHHPVGSPGSGCRSSPLTSSFFRQEKSCLLLLDEIETRVCALACRDFIPLQEHEIELYLRQFFLAWDPGTWNWKTFFFEELVERVLNANTFRFTFVLHH